jgi:acetyl esterase/lipase
MLRSKLMGLLLCSASLALAAKSAKVPSGPGVTPPNYDIPLWPAGHVPHAMGDGPLDQPFVTVFQPLPGKANGASVVIAPGGSNIMLMYGGEGIDVAETYNDWGVTAFVLTYRLAPRYKDDVRVMDARRAVQLVRSRAAEFHLDPNRVGYIGFSAGSNLGRLLGDAAGPGDTAAADPIDRFSSRPDYLGLVYGPGRPVAGEPLNHFPPTFITAAQADQGASLGSAQLFIDLTKAGVVAELHLYQKGRHGYGSGFANGNFSDWMPRLKHFLEQGSFLPGGRE